MATRKPGYGQKGYRFPGKKPTANQLGQIVGKRQEDGSFRVKGGGVYDPDTGRIRKRRV